MTHTNEDQLLLLAYGELPAADQARIEDHLAQCDSCRAELTRLETARVAIDVGLARRRTDTPWLAISIAAAAVLGFILVISNLPTRPAAIPPWRPTSEWSTTAGYVTGGRTLIEIDAQLTRLEQERYYALPN